MMLQVNNIEAFYGNIQALYGVSFEVKENEIVTIIGSNGAGKTTILKSICGILKARTGDIVFEGEGVRGLHPSQIVSRGLVMCPEGRQLWPNLTVQETLEMGAFIRDDTEGIKRDMERLFKVFPILEQRKKQLAGSLSGGEQQALAIARALMAKPKLILFDEPSLGLAPKLVNETLRLIKELKDTEGLTVLLVEQNAYAALKIADRAYVLEKGKITLSGPAQELIDNDHVREAYLGM